MHNTKKENQIFFLLFTKILPFYLQSHIFVCRRCGYRRVRIKEGLQREGTNGAHEAVFFFLITEQKKKLKAKAEGKQKIKRCRCKIRLGFGGLGNLRLTFAC